MAIDPATIWKNNLTLGSIAFDLSSNAPVKKIISPPVNSQMYLFVSGASGYIKNILPKHNETVIKQLTMAFILLLLNKRYIESVIPKTLIIDHGIGRIPKNVDPIINDTTIAIPPIKAVVFV
ncbi:hypothetical protein NH26_18695 [Flammeovirga pacifica]|uniref:Uncharacterized protein n=1 Tax=Flammeovirga pacifica TaxID=915059 RepID=A0A1S1Z4L7_FLAPC|nr:hypothetical protein NH26_18695 [Flammeovirga pacifica]